jgi:hypothetical protein
VGGVHGQAFGGVHRRRVPERQVLGHVFGGQDETFAKLLPFAGVAVDRGHDQATVFAGFEDAVLLPIDGAGPVACHAAKFPAVAASLHDVPYPGDGVLAAQRHAGLLYAAELHELGADLGAEPVGLFVAVHDQQRTPTGQGVGEPAVGGDAFGAFERAAVDDPPVLAVGLQRGFVALPQSQGGVAFPGMGEPAGFGQLVGERDAGNHLHAAGGADGGELAVVAGEEEFRVGGARDLVHRGEVGEAGHRGLVEHHQIPRREPPVLVVAERLAVGQALLDGTPLGDVARRQALALQDLGRDLGGGEPEDPSVLAAPERWVGPGMRDGADHE